MSQTETPPPVQDFLAVLASMPGVTAELSEKLQECVDATAEVGKQSTLSFTLKIALLDGNPDVVQILESVSHKPAEHDRKKKLMFRDSQGKLTRSDPNALSFENLATVQHAPTTTQLASVNPGSGEVKEVGR